MSNEHSPLRAIRSIVWQGLWRPGAEWCELFQTDSGWRLAGNALVAVDTSPYQARYEIDLDERWATCALRLAVSAGPGNPDCQLWLTSGEDGRWQITREPDQDDEGQADTMHSVHGLVDVDLGFSPATNTLPIRRLAPAIGDAVDVTALWVRFPALTIEPLPQRYTRLAERRYRYESSGGAFVAHLDVDDLGLVTSYEGGWQRIAEKS